MRIYDISVPVHSNMPLYPGDPAVNISQHSLTSQGDLVNISTITLGTHTGTHIDAPRHVDGDWPSLQDLDLSLLVGPAKVVELGVDEAITAKDLAGLRWEGVERLLFKTRNSKLWSGGFHSDFVYLSEDGARFLALNTEVRLVGIDYVSIERYGAEGLTVHRELLGRGIVILEGLDLSQVSSGEYQLICLPLRVACEDGAPVRAVLVDPGPMPRI